MRDHGCLVHLCAACRASSSRCFANNVARLLSIATLIACSRLKFETAAVTFAAPGTCWALVIGDEGNGRCGFGAVERVAGVWASPDCDCARRSWQIAGAALRNATTNVATALASAWLLEDRPRDPRG